jgi:hypothetical protein
LFASGRSWLRAALESKNLRVRLQFRAQSVPTNGAPKGGEGCRRGPPVVFVAIRPTFETSAGQAVGKTEK